MVKINILVTLLLVSFVLAQKNYTMFKNIDNPNNFQNVVYLPNYHLALLYGEENANATVYRTYDWAPITDSVYTDFHFGPSYVQRFEDGVHETNLIFCNSEGKIRQKSFTSAGSTSWSLWALDGNQTIRKVTASSDGKLFAAFSDDAIVYIGNLSMTDTVFQFKDYSPQGRIQSISWQPGTHNLFISGGLIHQNKDQVDSSDHFLISYNVDTKQQQDITFITHGKVMDLSFGQNNKLYFIEEVLVEDNSEPTEQIIHVHDLFSKGVQPFATITANVLQSVNARGNYLSAFDGENQYIFSTIDKSFVAKESSSSSTSGLAPNASVYISLTSQSSSVYLLCANLQHYYEPDNDTCQMCPEPCDTCFQKGAKCATCLPRYFYQNDFTCGQCFLGCYTCQSEDSCDQCDSENHFVSKQSKCVCDVGFLFINQTECLSCGSFMQGCAKCQKQNECQECLQGYDIDPDTKGCKESSQSHVVLIIIIIVAVLLVIVIVIFLFKRHKSKKAKHVETSLESEPLDDYEKVHD